MNGGALRASDFDDAPRRNTVTESVGGETNYEGDLMIESNTLPQI